MGWSAGYQYNFPPPKSQVKWASGSGKAKIGEESNNNEKSGHSTEHNHEIFKIDDLRENEEIRTRKDSEDYEPYHALLSYIVKHRS